jgi:hypothetical protein
MEKKMKTNRELNQEHDARASAKVRPKQTEYQFKELQDIINNWIRKGNEQT